MAYVKPEDIVENMLQAGAKKASLPLRWRFWQLRKRAGALQALWYFPSAS